MKTVFTYLTLILCCSLHGQVIEKFSIDSGGENFSDGSIQLLYTIGEVNAEELTVSNIHLSEGFINTSTSGALSANSLIKDQIIIYPNPTSKYLNISSIVVIDKIEVYNLIGKKVLETSNLNQIEINSFQSGLYLVKIYYENSFINKKIIIKDN